MFNIVAALSGLFWDATIHARIPILAQLTHYDHGPLLAGTAWEGLDGEINAISNILWLAKTRRNSLASRVVRLPSDILSRIFFWTMKMTGPLNVASSKKPAWINITHTCQRWRQLALQDVALWKHIELEHVSLSWGTEMVQRSRLVPLSIKTGFSLSPAVRAVFQQSATVARVQTLVIDGQRGGQKAIDTILKKPSASTTLLQSLSISHAFHKVLVLPARIFCNNTPNLRSLSLRGCFISWDSPLFANFTHLDIGARKRGDPVRKPMQLKTNIELSQLLARMPRLQTLALYQILPSVAYEELTPAGRSVVGAVELPSSLVSLRLMGPLNDCVGLALCLPLATSSSIKLAMDLEEFPWNGTPQPTPSIMRHVGGTHRPPRTMMLRCDERSETTQLRLYSDTCDMRGLPESVERECQTSLTLAGQSSFFFKTSDVCVQAPWEGLYLGELQDAYVRVLEDSNHVVEQEIWSKARWVTMFGRAQGVRTLRVEGCACILKLLEAMTPSGTSPSQSFLFPYLTDLTLYCFNRTEEDMSPRSRAHISFHSGVMSEVGEALEACIRARSVRGVHLQSLEVDPVFRPGTTGWEGDNVVTVYKPKRGSVDSVFLPDHADG
ncbi:hypothetical protein BV25DRAFT_1917943 [Artomyces pyxidatus]|uniref:Uncharacterized protein n=1 Tax=Artomyces pyxidatus TaxID=48021 RepID=A0ACB8SV12_9AGAM|nr:hypothetical protein BV25DRAFT_1917943 [Artomyces pyxidatus]